MKTARLFPMSGYPVSEDQWSNGDDLYTAALLGDITVVQGINTKPEAKSHRLLRVHIFPARARGGGPGHEHKS